MSEAGEETAGDGRGVSSTHAERLELIGEPREPETLAVHRGPSVWIGWSAAAACAAIAAIGWYQAGRIGAERTRYAESLGSITADYEALAGRAESLDEMLGLAKSTLAASESSLASLRVKSETLEKRLGLVEQARDDLETRLAETVATLRAARERVEAQTELVTMLRADLSEADLLLARYTGTPGQDVLRASRGALLVDSGTIRFDWSPWNDPEIKNVTGDVVWNEELQTGFLRFVGLPANDPLVEEYQVWLVDGRGPNQDDGRAARVSGGVFGVVAAQIDETGEIIVPIRVGAGQKIVGVRSFSVTIEKPGGQPVSTLERRVVISK